MHTAGAQSHARSDLLPDMNSIDSIATWLDLNQQTFSVLDIPGHASSRRQLRRVHGGWGLP